MNNNTPAVSMTPQCQVEVDLTAPFECLLDDLAMVLWGPHSTMVHDRIAELAEAIVAQNEDDSDEPESLRNDRVERAREALKAAWDAPVSMYLPAHRARELGTQLIATATAAHRGAMSMRDAMKRAI